VTKTNKSINNTIQTKQRVRRTIQITNQIIPTQNSVRDILLNLIRTMRNSTATIKRYNDYLEKKASKAKTNKNNSKREMPYKDIKWKPNQ